MKIYTKVVWTWNDECKEYIKLYDHSFEYSGNIALACGASSQQKQIEQGQQNFFNQLTQQATQVFGGASSVFKSLVNTFTPTVAAGPNQQGFSPAELSAMQSQAITGTGQAYANAKAAVGNQEAAFGGGNVTLPSGVNEATDVGLAIAGANETAGSLNQITQENYAVGRQNYENAVKGLAQAPDVFNPASSAAGEATGAGTAAANTANQIAQEGNSWMSAVGGILGGVAGAATGGLSNVAGGFIKNLGNQNNINGPTPYGKNSD